MYHLRSIRNRGCKVLMMCYVYLHTMARYPNYYAILHVPQQAKAADIKHAWKSLLQKSRKHPDLGGNEEEAQLINEAYSVLKDPLRRAAYDRIHVGHVVGAAEIPIDHTPPDHNNRRRVQRADYVNEIFLQRPNSSETWTGQSQDISLYGVKLRSLEKIKAAETVTVSFAQDPGFTIQGTVRWQRMIPQRFGKPVYEAGVEFHGLHMQRFVLFLERSGLANQVSE